MRGSETCKFKPLLDATGEGRTSFRLSDINDARLIDGEGRYQGAWRAFMATPVTPVMLVMPVTP